MYVGIHLSIPLSNQTPNDRICPYDHLFIYITINLCAHPSFDPLTCLHIVHLLLHMVSLSIYFTLINQLIHLLVLPSICHPFTNLPFALPIYPPAFSIIPLPLQPSNSLSYTHPSIHSSINPSIISPSNDLPISPLIHLSFTHSFISASTHPPVLLYTRPSAYPSICPLSMYLFIHLFIYPFIYPSTYTSSCPSMWPSICFPIYLSPCPKLCLTKQDPPKLLWHFCHHSVAQGSHSYTLVPLLPSLHRNRPVIVSIAQCPHRDAEGLPHRIQCIFHNFRLVAYGEPGEEQEDWNLPWW